MELDQYEIYLELDQCAIYLELDQYEIYLELDQWTEHLELSSRGDQPTDRRLEEVRFTVDGVFPEIKEQSNSE